ncbi:MAG: type III-A CRISPR-associated RAMP protein Csm5 [Deltaproteobacteria bacterium]|nr:type III-A CRISPR-associated RAMP protein Csm5 [Deltaproteobacteria bacterium]RLB33314.1 MAG: type III-A CRISPR-associated RAMP protein Csm5 [Deltaproteobacteria bacterium]
MIEKGYGKFRFTVISPVHVGSGRGLGPVDTVIEKNRCIVIDIESLLLGIQDNEQALNEFGQGRFNVTTFLKRYRISPKSVEKYSIPNPDLFQLEARQNIHEMVKTGLGNPYIPGSSIKGAIRTVILWHLFKEERKEERDSILKKILNSNVRKERADDQLDQHLFGDDPNHDFLRALQIGDVEFRLSDLGLIESKVLSLSSRRGFGWKGFKIYCETLVPGSLSRGIIRTDQFLTRNTVSLKELKLSGIKKSLLESLPEKCNQFAQHFITEEIEFFESCSMNQMVNFYRNLLNKMPEGNDSFLLHLGWGSGWRGMTGNYFDDDMLKQFRKKFYMGKGVFPLFPKTRKIAFEDGSPKYAFGWIKLEGIHSLVDDESEAQPTRPVDEIKKSEFMQNFEAFRLRPSPDHFREFIEGIKEEEIPELQNLSFKELKSTMNIGFVSPLMEANISDEIRKILARKLIEVVERRKKWKGDKLERYEKLRKIVEEAEA